MNIALPSLQRDLGISDGDRQWIITAYTLAFGSLLLLGGRIAGYTDRKRTFLMGLLGLAGPRSEGSARFDIPGVLLVIGGLVAIVYATGQAESDGWGSTKVIGLLADGAVLNVGSATPERYPGRRRPSREHSP